MKTLQICILCFGFFLCNVNAHGQTVNGIKLKDIDVDYVEIIGVGKMLNNKVTIHLDFGQENKISTLKDTRIADADGKALVLNSMVEALNFMSANGYQFVQAYTEDVAGVNVTHFLLKRKQ